MVQLIITVLAISLAAAAALVSINYLPWWVRTAAETEAGIRHALLKLETAYVATGRSAPAGSLEPTADSDGGLMARFGGILGYPPAAPMGYQWGYGKQTEPGAYANMHYFCLAPDGTLPGRDESAYRAMLRGRVGYSSAQYFINTACGATASADLGNDGTDVPVLTFYVRTIPDVGL